MVEGTPLLRVQTGNRLEGSNPFVSAIYHYNKKLFWLSCRIPTIQPIIEKTLEWFGQVRRVRVRFFFHAVYVDSPTHAGCRIGSARHSTAPRLGSARAGRCTGGKGAAAGYSRAQLRGLLPTGPLYRLLHRLHSWPSPPRILGERGRTHCPSRPPLFAGAGRDGPLGMHAWARCSSAQGSNRVRICNLSPFPLS